jgi:uncharacterized membrane protein YcjF (UPF0283 family)
MQKEAVMSPEDQDDLAGIPIGAPERASGEVRAAQSAPTVEIEGRDAADEAIPLGEADSVTAVSPDAQSRRDAERDREVADQALQKVLQADAERSDGILRRTCRGLFMTAIAIVAGFGGILLSTQLIQAIQILRTWPSWLQAIGWMGLGSCCLLVIWSVGRLLWFVIRFRRNRPLTRQLLDQREHLRELASQVHAAARVQLSAYMQEYPLDDAEQREFLRKWGISQSEFEMMKRKRTELLDAGNLQDSKTWQESFETCFLALLDTAADNFIKDCAFRTAVKTAICPYALLDMAIVLHMGTYMLGSLCRVYQLRAGPLDMLYLFALVMAQSFFAAQAEEHAEEAISAVSGKVAPDVAGKVPVLGKLVGGASQGLANYFLLSRIGRSACKLLRPLRA